MVDSSVPAETWAIRFSNRDATGLDIPAWNRGFCRRIAAVSVEPERGSPDMKCMASVPASRMSHPNCFASIITAVITRPNHFIRGGIFFPKSKDFRSICGKTAEVYFRFTTLSPLPRLLAFRNAQPAKTLTRRVHDRSDSRTRRSPQDQWLMIPARKTRELATANTEVPRPKPRTTSSALKAKNTPAVT